MQHGRSPDFRCEWPGTHRCGVSLRFGVLKPAGSAVSRKFYMSSYSSDSLGDIWKIIYLGFEKSQSSVTHDSLRYINILTYLRTYLLRKLCILVHFWYIMHVVAWCWARKVTRFALYSSPGRGAPALPTSPCGYNYNYTVLYSMH